MTSTTETQHETAGRYSPRWEFLLFLITGGVAALVNVVSRVGFSQLLRFELAVLLAYGVGMLTAYVLARKFVFACTVCAVPLRPSPW